MMRGERRTAAAAFRVDQNALVVVAEPTRRVSVFFTRPPRKQSTKRFSSPVARMDECASQISSFTPSSSSSSLGSCHFARRDGDDGVDDDGSARVGVARVPRRRGVEFVRARGGASSPLSRFRPRAPRRLVPATLSRPRRAPASPPRAVGDDVAMRLFSAAQSADDLVGGQLSGGVTPATFAVVLAAGLVTSLSPCTLSVLPLTVGYIVAATPPPPPPPPPKTPTRRTTNARDARKLRRTRVAPPSPQTPSRSPPVSPPPSRSSASPRRLSAEPTARPLATVSPSPSPSSPSSWA